MKIAVLTLTRDRLAYTQHCFQALQENAGCDYDHFVLDQGSSDGTAQWLRDEYDPDYIACLPKNVGISRGMNTLLDWAAESADYDVIVKFDNDCELLTPFTLYNIADLIMQHDILMLSPHIHGLRYPPATIRTLAIEGALISEKQQIGGIFLAAPASLYEWFRYSDNNPLWGVDDAEVCARWRHEGGVCGYVGGYSANHYETTDGQHARFPAYFARTIQEGKSSL